MLKAGLVGVTGYTGMELARILAGHPAMKLVMATSRQEAGKRLDELYPFLRGLPGGDVIVREADAAALSAACDVVFLAVPHGVAMEMGAALYDAGARVVDLSADFRLRDAAVYENGTERLIPAPAIWTRPYTVCRSCAPRKSAGPVWWPIPAAIPPRPFSVCMPR